MNRPRARITVAPRSFLDAGTEVLPGERKFTDYAFPPNYFPMGTVTNTGGKVGWDHLAAAGAVRPAEPAQSLRLVGSRAPLRARDAAQHPSLGAKPCSSVLSVNTRRTRAQ